MGEAVVLMTMFAMLTYPAAQGVAAAPKEPTVSEEGACLKCHSPIQAALQKKVVHAAVEMGCSTCHINHRAAPRAGGPKVPRYLNAGQPDLCLTCHEAKDEKTAAAHRGQPFEKAICTGCHDPHGSDAPKLLPARAHGPYAARQCDGCHQAPQAGRVKLVANTARELCYRCHEELGKRVAEAKVGHTLVSSDANSCLDCHDPHASPRDHFLKRPVNTLCNSCHAGVIGDRRFVHEPLRSGCVLCHDPHASDFAKHLRAPLNALCLECHGAENKFQFQAAGPVTLFEGGVKLPKYPFENLPRLELRAEGKMGHPLANHPVFAPAAEGKPELNCISCHRPHAGEGGWRRFVTETASSNPLCVRCH